MILLIRFVVLDNYYRKIGKYLKLDETFSFPVHYSLTTMKLTPYIYIYIYI